MKIIKQLIFLSPMLLFSLNAYANQINSSGLLDNLLDKYQQVASTWTTVLGDYANWLFWGLVLISMVWTFGMIAMKGGGFQDLLAEVVRFFAINGFFFFILKNGPAISKSIIDSLRELAGNALGTGNGISPSSIVDMAFVILTKVSSAASIWSPMISTIMITVAIIVLVVMSLIAVNMLIMLVSAWVMCYAGIILLGFGGSKLTSDITVNYLRTVLSVGIQLFVMTLIIGIGQSFIDQYFSVIKDDVPDLNSLIVLLLASIVLLVLTNRLPQLLSGIVGGASLHGMGGFGAGMIAGATTAISSAGSIALSATAQASGGASALKAAFESAQAAMAEESGSGNGAGSSGASEDTGNVDAFGSGAGASRDSAAGGGSNGSTSGGSKGFAQSFSKAGRMASHMGSSLINGAMDYQTTNQKINSTRARQTIGEEVADHIRKRSSAQAGNREHTEFEGDSLSGSKNS